MPSPTTPVLQFAEPSPPDLSANNAAFKSSSSSISPNPKDRILSLKGLITPPPLQPSGPKTLLTPPADRDGRPGARQDGSYFPSRTQYTTGQGTRSASPSDNRSNSPGLSPSTRSHNSSDVGISTCSGSSNELLTAPLFQGDQSDLPPYKPLGDSNGSLTMLKKARRANTMPYDKEARRRLKEGHSRKSKCGHRKAKKKGSHTQQDWSLAGCQVVPTAPRGQKDMCEEIEGHHTKSKLRNTDAKGRPSSKRTFGVPSAIVGRRWSSVEIGAHQIISELTAALRPTLSSGLASPTSEYVAPRPLGPRFKSSSFTRGAMDNDIVRTVRERLTLRKLPSLQLQVPASITLRRASVVSSQSETSHTPGTAFKSLEPSVATTPLAKLQGLLQQQKQTTYLITSKDIDSITALIEQNIRRQYETRRHSKATTSSVGSDSPIVTRKGVVVPQSLPDVAITTTDAQTRSHLNDEQVDYLQVTSRARRRNSSFNMSGIDTPRSIHEVIWQGGSSARSRASTLEDAKLNSMSYGDDSSGAGTPRAMFQHQECKAGLQESSRNNGSGFDPQNANASINEWSLEIPQNDIAVVVTSSDSESNDNEIQAGSKVGPQNAQDYKKSASMEVASFSKARQKRRVRPPPRPAVSDSNLHQSRSRGLTLKDVESFPALNSRKTTEEGHIPLPEMISTAPMHTTQSLYDLGLDVNLGPLSSSSKTVTPKASFTNLTPTVERTPPQMLPAGTVGFNPEFDLRKKSVIKCDSLKGPLSPAAAESNQEIAPHRKSVVKEHLWAVPRMGDLTRMGSALGCHGHERRRSSAVPGARVKRVRTIDNEHKGEHAPPSKWRKPSVCPSPRPPSPMSPESSRPPSPANTSWRGFFDRAKLVKDRSPQQPKVDPVGIYAQLTGVRGTNVLKDPCLLESAPCRPHDCDDCANDPRKPSVDWIG